MSTTLEKFEINSDGITYIVERSPTDKNIYRLSSPRGTYVVAKDFYGIWVELTSKPNSASIRLTVLGDQIEEYYNTENVL